MKQVLQKISNGKTHLVDAPCPSSRTGRLVIATSNTLVSSGTERMLIGFGKANWLNKARQQPDKVRMVLDKIKTDGLRPTIEAVLSKLDQPLPLGYCNVGYVKQLGLGVDGFKVGDRVISNGKHAEVVSVPKNLCAKVPDGVSEEEAAFTVLAAIALQGVRLVKPTLGETVVVTGLGLVGLLTVQLLRANGCRVLGLDFDEKKLQLARQFGAQVVDLSSGQDPMKAAEYYSRFRGVDAVIITAATDSNEPMHQAALMCRKRGRIVLVGVTGLELSRDDFFKKELSFQVSASYGPGRYDPNYEDKGQDYPVGFVRWTEQRNFEAVLDLMDTGQLNVKPLISHQFEIDNADQAYELIGGDRYSLGILLNYPRNIEIKSEARLVNLSSNSVGTSTDANCLSKVVVGFIGAGNYATSVLIPAFKRAGVDLRGVACNAGVSGVHIGHKYGFHHATTDSDNIITDGQTDAVVISTRHDSHADLVIKSLAAGKHVFVEKPLCLRLTELEEIERAYTKALAENNQPILMVGFNRRFAPQVEKIKLLLQGSDNPKALVMTVNAGHIDSEHWTQDKDIGGGRIVGEACHFIDLLTFLVDSPIVNYDRVSMSSHNNDSATLQFAFADGSIGTIHYLTNGSKSFPKERLEVFASGAILQLDNYRVLKGFGWPGFSKMNLWRQDKGQNACAQAFANAVATGSMAPISIEDIISTSRIAIELG